jgi:hypothetical protein
MGSTLKSLAVLLLVAAVWWSMAALALSFDTIEAGVRDLNRPPPVQDGLWIVDDHGSYCCDDFYSARGTGERHGYSSVASAKPTGVTCKPTGILSYCAFCSLVLKTKEPLL